MTDSKSKRSGSRRSTEDGDADSARPDTSSADSDRSTTGAGGPVAATGSVTGDKVKADQDKGKDQPENPIDQTTGEYINPR